MIKASISSTPIIQEAAGVLVIRVPLFRLSDGRTVGEVNTVLPHPSPGVPLGTLQVGRASLDDAVRAVREYAVTNGVEIFERDVETVTQPAPASETMTVGTGGSKEMPPGLAETMTTTP